MTVNPAYDDADEPPAGAGANRAEAERVVATVRESFASVAPKSDDVTRHIFAILFTIAPDMRQMFPVNMATQRRQLLQTWVHLVQLLDRPAELRPFLEQLGRDLRRFDVAERHFEAFGTAVIASVRQYSDEWTDETALAWADAYATIAQSVRDGMRDDSGPAWWHAKVVEHVRLDPETAVIRLRTPAAVPYEPGQYVSVEAPQRPSMWRYLSPANAPREDNTIDFHVRLVDGGWVSRGLVGHTRVGDVWKIGRPLGNLWANKAADRPILMVAGGTGVAPMRAIIDELSRRPERPDVTMFFGGRSVKYLYNLAELRVFAEQHDWFTLNAVTDDGSLDNGLQGTLADVVTSKGSWSDHDVLVAGSPQMIRSTVSAMLVEGTPFDQISYDSFPTT